MRTSFFRHNTFILFYVLRRYINKAILTVYTNARIFIEGTAVRDDSLFR